MFISVFVHTLTFLLVLSFRMKKIQLTSEEPPYNFSKTSDFNLAESVHKYSTVGDSCLPLVNTIDFPENVSAFFSRQLDEYADVKHQTKSVDAVKQVQTSASNVSSVYSCCGCCGSVHLPLDTHILKTKVQRS